MDAVHRVHFPGPRSANPYLVPLFGAGRLMDFVLLLLTTAVLLLRPQDFSPETATIPVYLGLLVIAGVVAAGAILAQGSPEALRRRPITVCMFGLFAAILLSHLSQGSLWGARSSGVEFAKVLLLYVLVVAVVNTPARLQRLMTSLAGFALIVATLALLQYHEVITLPQATVLQQREYDEETGDESFLPRLCGTGLFNDPNDLCLLLVIGMGVAGHALAQSRGWFTRLPWLGALGVFVYALALTQSRGGFLAFLVGLLLLFHARFGTWKAAAFAGVAVPVLMLLFAGRQTTFTDGTQAGEDRIVLWREALTVFKEAPLFGIGQGLFEDHAGLVAHNSFVHCYAELGFFGGTLFLGAFLIGLWTLYRLGRPGVVFPAPSLQRLRPYVLAILAAYAMGMMTLSRAYIAPTYLVLGLATAYLSMATRAAPLVLPRFDFALVRRLALASVAFILIIHVFVKVSLSGG
ncbi:hypothetical protein AYO44_07995 [Planctomycetaceae bacterium SCGC AG-212-F19]|nr:hypothetical protein AYO44_07995 [Planctomycetaceae bacterium SCGC AG-212-F19]